MDKPILKNGNSDPTANVQNVLREAVNRIDDLRKAETQRVNEQMKLRDYFNRLLEVAEAKRIDAIRAVDVAAVAVANERATAQAAVLANQVTTSAETLRTLVATTAIAQANQLAQLTTQLTDRLASLEKAQYEGVGKGRVVDPMMNELLQEVKTLRESNATIKGTGGGMRDMWGWVIGGIATLIAIASYLSHLKP